MSGTINAFTRRPSPVHGLGGEEWEMDMGDGGTLHMTIFVSRSHQVLIQALHVRDGCVGAFTLHPAAARAMADALEVLADQAEGIRK